MLILAACGSTKTPAQRVADCLNARSFLVQAAGGRVEGSSPDGVNFTLTLPGRVDDSGNPGARRLSSQARAAIRRCLS